MKDIILSLVTSENEKRQRFSEFLEFFKETITTIPPQILGKLDPFDAYRYMNNPKASDFKKWVIEFNVKDLEWWESQKDEVIIKKNGLARLKEDLEIRLKVLDLSLKAYLNDEE